ncbi:MAG: type II toxin-antitoxin system RelE/ParE family toxin [Rhodospirillales bacterium]
MAKTPPLAVSYRKSALRRVRGLSPAQRRTLDTVLKAVARDPGYRHNNLRPLAGVKDGFRLRLGDWRVSFVRDAKGGVIDVYEIEPRGSAYR